MSDSQSDQHCSAQCGKSYGQSLAISTALVRRTSCQNVWVGRSAVQLFQGKSKYRPTCSGSECSRQTPNIGYHVLKVGLIQTNTDHTLSVLHTRSKVWPYFARSRSQKYKHVHWTIFGAQHS